MRKRDIHVVRHPRGGWQGRRESADRASFREDTQQDAISHAQEIAKRDSVEVVIHRPDGTIRDSDSYGHDPCPPRDRKH